MGQSLVEFPTTMSVYPSDMERTETCQAHSKRSCCTSVQPSDRLSRNAPSDLQPPLQRFYGVLCGGADGGPAPGRAAAVPGRVSAHPGREHCPCPRGGRPGVAWAVPWEEDAEGQLGCIYKALLFPVRVGECETVPVACLFTLSVRKTFFFSPLFPPAPASALRFYCLHVGMGISSPQ